MPLYEYYNPNPCGANVGDCAVRAIAKALGQDWDETYIGLAIEGFLLCNMPSGNHVWGAYLRRKGFTRETIPMECADVYTVTDFARDHPRGTYILALSSHVVCVEDGVIYDSWNSGNECPLYYWCRKEDA